MTPQEINEAVARKLGYHIGSFTKDGVKHMAVTMAKDPLMLDQWGQLPDYCHSIEAAWEIVEKIKDWELILELQGGERHGDRWVCRVLDTSLEAPDWVYGDADTAPVAICLAFLKLP